MSFSFFAAGVLFLSISTVGILAVIVLRKLSPETGIVTIIFGLAGSVLLVVGGFLALKFGASILTPRTPPVITTLVREHSVAIEVPPPPAHPASPVLTAPVEPATLSPHPGNPALWAAANTEQFTANIYPSLSGSVVPLVQSVKELLNAKLNKTSSEALAPNTKLPEPNKAKSADDDDVQEQPAKDDTNAVSTGLHLRLTGHLLPDRSRDIVMQAFHDQLQKEFADGDSVTIHKLPEAEATEQDINENSVMLTLQIDEKRAISTPWDSPSLQQAGRLRCDILTVDGTVSTSARFIEKPWVEHFDVFVTERPDKRFVVGYSGEFTSSESEARRQAMLDARRKARFVLPNAAVVRPDERHVVDRFAQKLSRPYGDVWREAVLLDVSQERMAPMIAQTHNQVQRTQVHRRSILTSLALLFGITVLVSITLNFLTQGYYRQRLLVAGVLVTAGLLLAMTFSVRSHQTIVPPRETATAMEFIP